MDQSMANELTDNSQISPLLRVGFADDSMSISNNFSDSEMYHGSQRELKRHRTSGARRGSDHSHHIDIQSDSRIRSKDWIFATVDQSVPEVETAKQSGSWISKIIKRNTTSSYNLLREAYKLKIHSHSKTAVYLQDGVRPWLALYLLIKAFFERLPRFSSMTVLFAIYVSILTAADTNL